MAQGIKFTFSMPDDESLAEYISIKGEKGDGPGATKTSELVNDSDFTTNAALNAGLATKADASTVQSLSNQVTSNTNAITSLQSANIEITRTNGGTGRWYKVTTLPVAGSTAKSASLSLNGRIGCTSVGQTGAMAHIDLTIANRSSASITARGDYYAREGNDDRKVVKYTDILIYKEQDDTYSVYIWIAGWVDIKLNAQFHDCDDEFDNTYITTEPSGTLIWSLSTNTDIQKNVNGTISADITGDAQTVNGHTVDTDVPPGAVFTDTIYDDSALQAEIDLKADSSDVASTYATKTEVQSIASGAPLVASSTSGMTDISRIYVNTSDGNWYYYDGSAWVAGGVYQATGVTDLQDASVGHKAITTGSLAHFTGYNLSDQAAWGYTYDNTYMSINPVNDKIQNEQASYLANFKSIVSRIPRGAFITVAKSAATNRFRIGLTNTKPAHSVQTSVVFADATKTRATFYNDSYDWVVICYTSSNESTDINIYVDNRSLVKNEAHADNLAIMQSVDAAELYNEQNKIIGEGTGTSNMEYRYKADATYRTYNFMLDPNTSYTVTRTGGNKFRVCLWFDEPVKADASATGQLYYRSRPNKVVIDDDSATTVTFNSEGYLWCTILYSNNQTDATFSITNENNAKRRIARQYIEDYLDEQGLAPIDGGYVINGEPNANNSIWSQWDARLAFGMNPSTAPVPAQFNGQIYVNGTIIAHNNGVGDRQHNRWGFHVYEAYASDNYSRMTMLLNKHDDEFDGKPSLEYYYYTGANHKEPSYGNVKIGSDVKYHSFMFNRDKMIAAGVVDCRFPIELARINPNTDIDGTYETVAEADAAHEPENDAAANSKCLKYIYLKNAQNGAMWYDTARNKVVVKINGKWHDMNTTEVPDGTYSF